MFNKSIYCCADNSIKNAASSDGLFSFLTFVFCFFSTSHLWHSPHFYISNFFISTDSTFTIELQSAFFISLVTTWLRARSYSFIHDTIYNLLNVSFEYADFAQVVDDRRFLKIFELLMEIGEKSTILRQVVKGSYFV